MEKIRLALLSGGISSERDVSLSSGRQVFQALDKSRYDITHYDPKTDLKQLVMDSETIDAALIILHGPFGEDGTIQGLLDLLDIPYQGAGVLGSAVAMNKKVSKILYKAAHIPVPDYLSLSVSDPLDIPSVLKKMTLPLVVKPACAGSSVGMTIVKDEKDLEAAIDLGFMHDDTILIEAYIKGIELTCGVLGNQRLEALPLIEIIPGDEYEFFDYHAKYTPGATREICPARIDPAIAQKAQELSIRAHQALFLSGYSRTDMILSGQDIFVLETNTIPGMTATSLYPQSAQAAGLPFSELLDRLIDLAISEHETKKLRRKI